MDITINSQTITTSRLVSAQVDGVRYTITVSERDNAIVNARASVSRLQEIEDADGNKRETYSLAGIIYYDGESVQTQRLTLDESAVFVPQFTAILAELKGGVS
jgi:hypothetical protein